MQHLSQFNVDQKREKWQLAESKKPTFQFHLGPVKNILRLRKRAVLLLIRKWNPVWATPQEERLVLLLPIAPWDVFHLHPGCQDHFYPRCQDHHPHINNERGNCAICIPTTFLRHNPSWLLATHSQSKATSSSHVVKTSSITNPNNH